MINPVQVQAHRLADHLSSVIPPDGRPHFADVTTVTAGAARGGTALVKVTRFGAEVVASGGYINPYTPVVGDRVICQSVDNQLVILGKVIGQP